MIDFHTHILPGIDDGSRDREMTEAMLREEARQGVGLVVATPHFYADRMSIDGFLAKRAEALRKTERLRQTADQPLPAVIAGAEVHFFPGIGRAEEISRLCIDGTRTILIELPFGTWDGEVLRDVQVLAKERKLKVVAAHVERYIGLQKDRRVWNRMMELPLTPQINGESLLKGGGLFRLKRERKFCLAFLKEHPETILGSDCHNMTGRAPNLAAARVEIAAELGEKALKQIDMTAEKALEP